jgi:hypothetical protein
MGKAISDVVLHEMLECDVLPRLGGRRVVGWDLDSTLASTVKRRYLVPLIKAGGQDAPTWCDYSMLAGGDEPISGSVALMREMHSLGYANIAVSGRSLLAWDITWKWVRRYQVPLDAIVLRPAEDFSPNGAWKVRVLRALQLHDADIRLFFEDWGEAATEIFQETGIPVVGINPFDPEESGPRQGAL